MRRVQAERDWLSKPDREKRDMEAERERSQGQRPPGPRGQETSIAKMTELYRDQAREREAEAWPLGKRSLG